MRRATIVGGGLAFALLVYTVPFALSARDGYTQDRIKLELQQLSRENESLNTDLALLKNPTRVEAFAVQSGMIMRQSAQFVTIPRDSPSAPKPARTLLARLTAFRLH